MSDAHVGLMNEYVAGSTLELSLRRPEPPTNVALAEIDRSVIRLAQVNSRAEETRLSCEPLHSTVRLG